MAIHNGFFLKSQEYEGRGNALFGGETHRHCVRVVTEVNKSRDKSMDRWSLVMSCGNGILPLHSFSKIPHLCFSLTTWCGIGTQTNLSTGTCYKLFDQYSSKPQKYLEKKSHYQPEHQQITTKCIKLCLIESWSKRQDNG